jgi:hypothetical protein
VTQRILDEQLERLGVSDVDVKTLVLDGPTDRRHLVNWDVYLAPWIRHLSPLSATGTMHVVGVIEILAGVGVAHKPRYASYVVAGWLGGIVINPLTYSGFYDVALRDFGLMLGALTLARLASKFDPPGIAFKL